MCLNDICRDLTAVNEIVSLWSVGAPVSDIEKDVVLEKLRTVYSQIKSIVPEDICPQETPEAIEDEPDAGSVEAENTLSSDAGVVETENILSETGSTEVENILSDAVKKRKALLSLYDQETVEQAEESEEPAHTTEHHATVQGETMKEQTIGDAYAQQRTHDISSEINCRQVETLSGAIGINDKFLMIRDLFDGDIAAYEAAMRTFESFGDLDDAMVHIYENYNWSPDSAGVTMLVDLLTRKLS